MKILLVEDEKELSHSILSFITRDGYLCEAVFNYYDADQKIVSYEYDCAIIDIMIPGGSGLDLIKKIKEQQPKCGLIVISARNSLEDKIIGLDLGADDYITKPFHLAELNARIKSVIRRRNFDGNNQINLNELKIDADKHVVEVHQQPIELTRKEFDMLLFFVGNQERVLTKEAIAEHIWGEDSDTFNNFDFVYTHIKNLRKKLADHGSKDYIKSVYGVGYKFTVK
jgi:DNA-binding response OmpR family regulator